MCNLKVKGDYRCVVFWDFMNRKTYNLKDQVNSSKMVGKLHQLLNELQKANNLIYNKNLEI